MVDLVMATRPRPHELHHLIPAQLFEEGLGLVVCPDFSMTV